MADIEHRTVEANNIKLHIAEAGDGPLVVLCHGFPECWYSWRHQIRALADAGFRVVAPDQRGYGTSDAPDAIAAGVEGAPPAPAYMLEGLPDPGDDLPPWLTAEDVDTYVQAFTRSGFRGGLNWYRNIDHNWVLTAPFDGMKIEQPALFVTGDRDVVPFSAEAEQGMRAVVTDLRDVVVLPGIGHWTQQEAPDAVNDALLRFLKAL